MSTSLASLTLNFINFHDFIFALEISGPLEINAGASTKIKEGSLLSNGVLLRS